MSQQRISVIMSVRNGEKYLMQALESIANQTRVPDEIIVVDDGSVDATAELAQSSSLPLTVIKQQPAGIAAALNNGLEHSSGNFICFLDYDDVWPSHRTELLLNALDKNPQADGAFGAAINTNADLIHISEPVQARMHTCMMVRRELFTQMGLFDSDFGHAAHMNWTMRAVTMGKIFIDIPDIVLWRRIHGQNIGISDKVQSRADLLKMVRQHHQQQHNG
ncbi:MAG: glycosyltransferase [Actinobacteria bacterium]|uniref:Unannotated protein n=1 Tax=freshwater metagenome TaxID=449393 RepID=A0A6J5ZB71_9ZZZZ|nr:glycosyltransferase [Actinomycetota bacterium]